MTARISRRDALRLGAGLAAAAALGSVASPAGAATACPAAAGYHWNSARGMTCDATVSASDIAAFAATGGNLLRPSFANRNLMSKTSPYPLSETNFQLLDGILDNCEAHGIAVVVDPHTMPGLRDNYTTFPDDALWQDYTYHDQAVRLWTAIAQRYANRGAVIAGYDLLNEPAVPDARATSGVASWTELARLLTSTIRRYDTAHDIVVSTPISPKPSGSLWYTYFESVNLFPAPWDSRLVVSPHMYTPHAFTNQGLSAQYPNGVHYPGTVAGEGYEGLPASTYFDKNAMASYFGPALTYTQKYGVPLYVGEFSAVRWTGSEGNAYLRDCADYFEAHGWAWSYHSWREAQVWDAERSNTDQNDLTRYASTARLTLLEGYFGRN